MNTLEYFKYFKIQPPVFSISCVIFGPICLVLQLTRGLGKLGGRLLTSYIATIEYLKILEHVSCLSKVILLLYQVLVAKCPWDNGWWALDLALIA